MMTPAPPLPSPHISSYIPSLIKIHVTYNHQMVTLHETHLQLGQWTTLKMYLKLLTLPNLLYKKFSPPPLLANLKKP